MKKTYICALLTIVTATGCAQTNEQAKADVARFRDLISNGANWQISDAMESFFQTNVPVSKYEAILPLANESTEKDYGREYIFWFRGKNPRGEGSYWVEVGVDEKTKMIRSVRVNGLTK